MALVSGQATLKLDKWAPASPSNPNYKTTLTLGSTKTELVAAIDTMNQFTMIGKNAVDKASDTLSYVVPENQVSSKWRNGNDLGGTKKAISGKEANDQACLQDFCVGNFTFSDVTSDLKHDGKPIKATLALGPDDGESNIVGQMFESGVITRKFASLAYGRWDDATEPESTITFGTWDASQVVGGAKGMAALLNTAQGAWSVQLDSIKYGDQQVTEEDEVMRAHIDTTTHTIQLPPSVWEAFRTEVYKIQLPSGDNVAARKVNGHEVLTFSGSSYSPPCSIVQEYLKPMTIGLRGAEIVLQPKAYLTMVDSKCQVAVEKGSEAGVFRFGMAFLQNMYTVLDYEANEVHIGVQTRVMDSATLAKIDRHPKDPGTVDVLKKNALTWILAVICVLLIIGAIAIFTWQRQKMGQERHEMIQARLKFLHSNNPSFAGGSMDDFRNLPGQQMKVPSNEEVIQQQSQYQNRNDSYGVPDVALQ